MERLEPVAGRIAERDQPTDAALVGQTGGRVPHGNAGGFQPRGESIQCGGIRDLPAEEALALGQAAIDDQALLTVIHAESPHGSAAVNRLQAELVRGEDGPVVDLGSAQPKVTQCLHAHDCFLPQVVAVGATRPRASLQSR